MYENVQILKEYVEYVFDRLDRTVDGLTEKELGWKPLNESNNIRWTLNHISRLINISTMIYIKGDPSYLPEGWPEDYKEKQHTLVKLLGDISKGKAAVRAGLEDMKAADLLSEVTRRGTTRTCQLGLFIMISEVVHHGGQIAYLRGTIKRIREKDPLFLK
jgi:hypothetical protein